MAQRRKRKKALRQEIVGVIVIFASILVALSVLTDSAGVIGVHFRNVFLGIFGIFAYVLPFAGIAVGIFYTFVGSRRFSTKEIVCISIAVGSLMCVVHLAYASHIGSVSFFEYIAKSYTLGCGGRMGGGALISIVQYPLGILFGEIGSYAVFIAAILICALILTNLSLRRMGKQVGDKINAYKASHPHKNREDKDAWEDENTYPAANREHDMQIFHMERENATSGSRNTLGESEGDIEFIPGLPNTGSISYRTAPKRFEDDVVLQEEPPVHRDEEGAEVVYTTTKPAPRPPKAAPEEMKQAIADIQEEIDQANIEVVTYKIPPITMLSRPDMGRNSGRQQTDSRLSAGQLEQTFSDFGIRAKVINCTTGPSITRYEVQPAPGVKVSRIVNLADDIALSLAASKVRIEAPIPGKNAVGIEVPNKDRQPVMLREVLDTDDFKKAASKVSVALGKDIGGNVIVRDLAEMPHLLIAGTTGSGKSICINTLILSILFKATPQEVKMVMVDPKMVELSMYNDIPHLQIPVVTDPKKAAGALGWAVGEMTKRYTKFSERGVKQIKQYNDVMHMIGEEPLPSIVIIIDELADLMMVAPRDVEDSICRIAQMGRAAGIHLVVATQRPSVDVITGLIKANFPSRVGLVVSSQTDSRTILDHAGAEKLLGKGDMLFHTPSLANDIRIQGAFVADAEVEAVIQFIKDGSTPPQYDHNAMTEIDRSVEAAAGGKADGKVEAEPEGDTLLMDAISLCIDAGQASTSQLQRRFRIGYARAARLMDEMEDMGIISAQDGSRPRNILVSKTQFEAMMQERQVEDEL